jgi:neutral ceramidase
MRLVLAFAALLLGAAPSFAGVMRAGVAKADITPPPGELLWGFRSRHKPATGTIDPLYARVLVLEAGDKRLALVTLDLGRSFGPASLAQLRESAKNSSGISCLLVAASHTHSAPVVEDEYKNGPPAWERSALEKIERAIQEAAQGVVEARLGTGTGSVYIGHNRLRVNADGSVSWFERNLTQVPTAPVDPTVSVLRVDRVDGSPIAILTNYACHPLVFGLDNLQYSADFPAVMNRVVEEKFGARTLSFFLQGAPGDINPYFAVTPLEEDAVKERDWTGERLGREAARVAAAIHTASTPQPSIDFTEESLPARVRWDQAKLRAALPKAGSALINPELQLPVTTVLIDKQIALATVPGEPFVEFQMNWRDRCPVPTAFFLGYTNGYYGYFPTIAAASRGGYGAASTSTWVEVGAGERIVDRALVRVYEMLGKLTDVPDDLKRDVFK